MPIKYKKPIVPLRKDELILSDPPYPMTPEKHKAALKVVREWEENERKGKAQKGKKK